MLSFFNTSRHFGTHTRNRTSRAFSRLNYYRLCLPVSPLLGRLDNLHTFYTQQNLFDPFPFLDLLQNASGVLGGGGGLFCRKSWSLKKEITGFTFQGASNQLFSPEIMELQNENFRFYHFVRMKLGDHENTPGAVICVPIRIILFI